MEHRENPAARLIREAKERFELEAQKRTEAAMKPRKPGAKRFSTQYAVEWGRSQGWTLLDRERYDARTKRHHDLWLGADALFEGPNGLILVQAAGQSERTEHLKRFGERGGVPRCQKLNVEFWYVEFKRESKIPTKVERWDEGDI